MVEGTENEIMMVRYLLGYLDEDEQKRIEEEYFANDDLFEELLIVEEELIDDYVRGSLSGPDLKRFEGNFLTTKARRDRVEFSSLLLEPQNLASAAPAPPKSRPHRWSWPAFLRSKDRRMILSLASLVLAIMLGAVWLAVERVRLRDQIGQERARQAERQQEFQQQIEEQRERNEQLNATLERERDDRNRLEEELARLRSSSPTSGEPTAGSDIYSALLTNRLVRDATPAQMLNLPAGAKQLRLRINLEPDDYVSYQGELRTEEGEEIYRQTDLRAQQKTGGKTVALTVAAGLLADRKYILTLRGVTSEGEVETRVRYYFAVSKK